MSKNYKESNIYPCFYHFMISETKKKPRKLLVAAILSSSIKILLKFVEKTNSRKLSMLPCCIYIQQNRNNTFHVLCKGKK